MNEGEHRLSHWFGHLLERILLEPCWFTAQDHSGAAIGNSPQKQMNWRAKQKWYGVKPSQLDWRIYQSPVYAEIELKYGDGRLETGQETTIRLLTERGIPTGVCWTLEQGYQAVRAAGFRLHANAGNILLEVIERHAAAEMAAGVKAPTKKRSSTRATGPRYEWGKSATKRAAARGVLI